MCDPRCFGSSGTDPIQDLSVTTLPIHSTEAVARELLLAALEDLSQEQLKRFRHKLRDAPLNGRSIPWGRLERADTVDLVDKLMEFYEPELAVEITRQVLKKSDIRDVALRLKGQQLQSKLSRLGWGRIQGLGLDPHCSPGEDQRCSLSHLLRLCHSLPSPSPETSPKFREQVAGVRELAG